MTSVRIDRERDSLISERDSAYTSAAIGKTATDFLALTWGNFFVANLLPVTIGNMIGGSIMVAAVYWFVYLRKQ